MSNPLSAVWTGRKFHFDLSRRSIVMGILNVTPDSFSEEGLNADRADAVIRGLAMAAAGADILDVGGESTRPGADSVDPLEEMNRVVPVIRDLAGKVALPISVDTRKAVVAQAALDAGACIVNDVTGLAHDSGTAGVVKDYEAGLVLMHIRGAPKDMQNDTVYDDLFRDIIDYLQCGVRKARDAGIAMERIVVDPGIGFGKSAEQNFDIIANLEFLAPLGRPILMGLSRKSFLGRLSGRPPQDRLMETVAATLEADRRGARIHRVHDVAEVVRALRVRHAIEEAGAYHPQWKT